MLAAEPEQILSTIDDRYGLWSEELKLGSSA